MYIGVDIGGTNIAAGVVNYNGKILTKKSIPTGAERETEEIVNDLISLINDLINEISDKEQKQGYKIKGIGLGIPGVADKEGNIISCVNLGWENIPMAKVLEEEFQLPVYLDNDASVATLAEYEAGVLKDTTNSLMLTLGTGIGGGIIINGTLFNGSHGAGSEIGHMVVGENFYNCGCGKNGCLETFSSATGLIRYTKKLIEEGNIDTNILNVINNDISLLDAKVIVDSAKKGDILANKAIERLVKYLSIGITNLISIFDPEVIAIGGGLSKAGDYLIKKIKKEVETMKLFKNVRISDIAVAKLENDAGIIGAGMLCKYS